MKGLARPVYGHALALAGLLALLLLAPLGLNETWTQLAILWGINTLLAQSINLLTGFAGQISLGHAGFFAIGAYGSALLMLKLHAPLWLSVPAAMALAVAVGWLLTFPAGRVYDFYLAMVTTAFGLVVQFAVKQWDLTGGFMGLSGIPSPVLGNLTLLGVPVSLRGYYYLTLALTVATIWLLRNLVQSRAGRAMVAVETSELAAASLGVHPGQVKQSAYMFSAAVAALAGTLYAHLMAFLSYDSFGIWASASILVMATLGGLGTFSGPILGALVLTILPHELQFLNHHQLLVYGLLLFFSYLILPRGLAGLLGNGQSLLRVLPGATPRYEGSEFPITRLPVPQEVLLEVKAVQKAFAGVRALSDVSLRLDAGTIHGLIGPNGSGKSTLVNVITGIYPLDGGQIRFRGEAIAGLPPASIARRGVVRTFQNPQVFRRLTVQENLLVGAHRWFRTGLLSTLLGAPQTIAEEQDMVARTAAILERMGLAQRAAERVADLPYGMQRLVEVARATACRPTLLILDEPAAGLSESELQQLAQVLRALRAEGVSILLIEHHLHFLLELADQVTVLDYGETIFTGTPAQVRRDPRVIEAYLGAMADAGA